METERRYSRSGESLNELDLSVSQHLPELVGCQARLDRAVLLGLCMGKDRIGWVWGDPGWKT